MPWLKPRPCFLGLAFGGRYPPSAVPVQRGTSRTGHCAGRLDTRAARERGYKPRPREPHSLHQSVVTGDVPSTSEICWFVTEIGTYVKPPGLMFSDIDLTTCSQFVLILECQRFGSSVASRRKPTLTIRIGGKR